MKRLDHTSMDLWFIQGHKNTTSGAFALSVVHFYDTQMNRMRQGNNGV